MIQAEWASKICFFKFLWQLYAVFRVVVLFLPRPLFRRLFDELYVENRPNLLDGNFPTLFDDEVVVGLFRTKEPDL